MCVKHAQEHFFMHAFNIQHSWTFSLFLYLTEFSCLASISIYSADIHANICRQYRSVFLVSQLFYTGGSSSSYLFLIYFFYLESRWHDWMWVWMDGMVKQRTYIPKGTSYTYCNIWEINTKNWMLPDSNAMMCKFVNPRK